MLQADGLWEAGGADAGDTPAAVVSPSARAEACR
jgi:hypothetical protein